MNYKGLFGIGGAALAALIVAGGILAGCGGSSGDKSDTNRITTGRNGFLDDVIIGPSGGSTFISTATVFQASWTNAAPPPSEFTVALRRYKEESGGPTASTQRIDVNRQGNSLAWNISRKDNFDLDENGVYYLELGAPGATTIQSCFIATNHRAAPQSVSPAPLTRAHQDTSGNGDVANVQVSPRPGSCFIPPGQIFRLTWPAGTTPPSGFDVDLVRYREDTGPDAQKTVINDRGNFIYDVNRRDNFDLDKGGVYYLELRANGQATQRFAYIVNKF